MSVHCLVFVGRPVRVFYPTRRLLHCVRTRCGASSQLAGARWMHAREELLLLQLML